MKKRRTSHRLSVDDRMTIQACIHDHRNVTQIASRIGVNKSTISREISQHVTKKVGYRIQSCPHLNSMGLCNTCLYRGQCRKERFYYNYVDAQNQADSLKQSSRSKPMLPPEHIRLIDDIVTDGVRLGQSLHHIYVSNPILAKYCVERTIRRLCYRGNLTVKPHELRRYVVYKHHYAKSPQESQLRDIRVLIGRSYQDFLHYVNQHKRLQVVQYDSLVGKTTDTKAILTITFQPSNFQFGFVIQKNNPTSVRKQLSALFGRLDEQTIRKIFPINLCDNGVEFSYFPEIEMWHGQSIVHTFFTTPYRSTDKAECERNHEFVRYVYPKGKSLNQITQEDLNDVFSNINSYVRKVKGDQTPFDLVRRRFGQAFLDAIGIRRIPNKKVKLTQLI